MLGGRCHIDRVLNHFRCVIFDHNLGIRRHVSRFWSGTIFLLNFFCRWKVFYNSRFRFVFYGNCYQNLGIRHHVSRFRSSTTTTTTSLLNFFRRRKVFYIPGFGLYFILGLLLLPIPPGPMRYINQSSSWNSVSFPR